MKTRNIYEVTKNGQNFANGSGKYNRSIKKAYDHSKFILFHSYNHHYTKNNQDLLLLMLLYNA